VTRAGATRRRGRAKGPSLWTLAAALVVIALASYAGANRVGGEVGRLERAAALAELAALHPDDPAVPRVLAAAVDWQATRDTKQALLAAGDLVAANRVDNAQVDPGFERLAALLRTTAADYSRAASAAQGRYKAGALAVVVAATLLSLVLLLRVERARSRQWAAEQRTQEALTNVARHARASKARVELTETAEGVVLEVHDDGIGFDPSAERLGGLDHFGLAGMRERVELAGGTWTVWSRPGSGTVPTASLPKALVAA
jgi:signal transduction histidine kinase